MDICCEQTVSVETVDTWIQNSYMTLLDVKYTSTRDYKLQMNSIALKKTLSGRQRPKSSVRQVECMNTDSSLCTCMILMQYNLYAIDKGLGIDVDTPQDWSL